MRNKIDILFDFKLMGINAYVPLFTSIIIILYVVVSMTMAKNTANLTVIISRWRDVIGFLELTIPFMAAWYSTFLFQEIFDEKGSETIFTYPVKRYEIGIVRVLIFFLIYNILLALILICIQFVVDKNIFLSLFIQLSMQGLFLLSLGFLCTTLTHSTMIGLTIVMAYVCCEKFTGGTIFRALNIYLFNGDVLPISNLMNLCVKIIVFSVTFLIVGQIQLNLFDSYK